MPIYTLEVGRITMEGAWTLGVYGANFHAVNLEAAKQEVDRRSKAEVIFAYDPGEALRVCGPDGSAQRAYNRDDKDGAWT